MQQRVEPDVVLEFKKCPACGSEEPTFVESLANEVKERKLMRPELSFYAFIVPVGPLYGTVRDASKEAQIPIGSKFPAYRIFLDACTNCGCFFARKLVRNDSVKTLNMETGIDPARGPNRQQRRHPLDDLPFGKG